MSNEYTDEHHEKNRALCAASVELEARGGVYTGRCDRLEGPRAALHRAPAATPRALERSVNLGQASRALQRRVPMALAYYRRDGVASAVWAGVAASVAVTTVVWLPSRNGQSPSPQA